MKINSNELYISQFLVSDVGENVIIIVREADTVG